MILNAQIAYGASQALNEAGVQHQLLSENNPWGLSNTILYRIIPADEQNINLSTVVTELANFPGVEVRWNNGGWFISDQDAREAEEEYLASLNPPTP